MLALVFAFQPVATDFEKPVLAPSKPCIQAPNRPRKVLESTDYSIVVAGLYLYGAYLLYGYGQKIQIFLRRKGSRELENALAA